MATSKKQFTSEEGKLAYKIVNEHTYENAIRSRTKWKKGKIVFYGLKRLP